MHMTNIMWLKNFIIFLNVLLISGQVYDVLNYGAKSDGVTKNTESIRKAIEEAEKNGGGIISFSSAGEYYTGPIHLKSNIQIHISDAAVVKFSVDFDDYLPMVRSRYEGTEVMNFSPLIYADGVHNISITGGGTLDGNGQVWWQYLRHLQDLQHNNSGIYPTDTKWQQQWLELNNQTELIPDYLLRVAFLRPLFIQFMNSSQISISGVRIKNSPFWTINPVYCNDVKISGINIFNPVTAPNGDGIDVDSTTNVVITNSVFNVSDDCIVIKSGRDRQGLTINKISENVSISNCVMYRGVGGVSIGSETSGGVRNVHVTNCSISGTDRGIFLKSRIGRGGIVENVWVNDSTMHNIKGEVILVRLSGADAMTEVGNSSMYSIIPRYRNIHFNNITGSGKQSIWVHGIEESIIDNVSFENIDIEADIGYISVHTNRVNLTNVCVKSRKKSL